MSPPSRGDNVMYALIPSSERTEKRFLFFLFLFPFRFVLFCLLCRLHISQRSRKSQTLHPQGRGRCTGGRASGQGVSPSAEHGPCPAHAPPAVGGRGSKGRSKSRSVRHLPAFKFQWAIQRCQKLGGLWFKPEINTSSKRDSCQESGFRRERGEDRAAR